MKPILLALLSISLLTACEPMPMHADGIDASDATLVSDVAVEAAADDALAPHVDGGGID